MLYPLLILFAIIFLELFMFFRINKDVGAIVTLAQESVHVLTSATIGDDEKETCMRRSSAGVFMATCYLAVKLLAIGAILYLLLRLITGQFPDLRRTVLESLVSPFTIALLAAVSACYVLARKAILARL